jgi:hypothetical protein
MDKNKFELAMQESREGNKKFHWNMAIFSGACLTIFLQFLVQGNLILDLINKRLLRVSIILLLISLIFSPVINFLSERVTSLFAQYEREYPTNKKEADIYYNKTVLLTRVRFVLVYASIISAFLGLIFLVSVVDRIYLK